MYLRNLILLSITKCISSLQCCNLLCNILILGRIQIQYVGLGLAIAKVILNMQVYRAGTKLYVSIMDFAFEHASSWSYEHIQTTPCASSDASLASQTLFPVWPHPPPGKSVARETSQMPGSVFLLQL